MRSNALDFFFAVDAGGQSITRQATCSLCGIGYTQQLLSERFMAMAERHSKGAVDAVMRDIPDLYVPRHCPPCEHRWLATQPRPEEMAPWAPRPRLTDRERFAKNMAKLFGAFNRPADQETVAAYWRALERSFSDDTMDAVVLDAIRTQAKWPTAFTLGALAKASR